MPMPGLLHATIVVRPQRAEILCQRLLAEDLLDDLTAMECRGYGRQKGHLDSYEGDEYAIDFLPKVVITGVVAEADRDRLIDLVNRTARTGRIGDGKIFLMPIATVVE
jgi:nitrogen regulatory protein PII